MDFRTTLVGKVREGAMKTPQLPPFPAPSQLDTTSCPLVPGGGLDHEVWLRFGGRWLVHIRGFLVASA